MMQKRRSIRKYTEEKISEEDMTTVLQAGLLSESSRGLRPWELIVIRDQAVLKKMADCRVGAAKMLANAAAAVVVVADGSLTDVWAEDCSVVMSHMHLMAHSLGLGSCWIQGRLREAVDGSTTEEYLRVLLGYPENYCLEAILSLGMPQKQPAQRELSELPQNKIHWDKF